METNAGDYLGMTVRHGCKCMPDASVSVEECLLAVSSLIGGANIRSASRMNKAIVLFLSEIQMVDTLIESGLIIKDTFVSVLPGVNHRGQTAIDTLHKEGKTQKVIAKEAGCSQCSVSKHINREAKGRKRYGRKNVQAIGITAPWRELQQNPFKNVGEIHKEWTAAGVSASRTTTHRRMQNMGFSCRIPCVKPLLNNRQRHKRLAWAKDKKDWTAAEWSKVMFSDESKFCISFGNQGSRVWRNRGEAQNPCCLRSSVKFPQSVMVWGAMSSAGVGPLCFLRSKVNAAVYQDVLEHFMLPAADQTLWRCRFHFPTGLGTCTQCQSYQYLV
ncbi:Transposable element Tcb2 transposase [Labeo rohita]|uniref:Transposable element Tcb2 transposase n=1 Tax=Labeo rohita TaxID=84645 RepID=A0ABQ8MVR8_LABRO|nr:Transposable element Tcb2 transposase [Labeo rohita]